MKMYPGPVFFRLSWTPLLGLELFRLVRFVDGSSLDMSRGLQVLLPYIPYSASELIRPLLYDWRKLVARFLQFFATVRFRKSEARVQPDASS